MSDGSPSNGHLAGIGKALVVVVTLAWIVFATIVVVLRYVVLPRVDDYRPRIEELASRASGETVRIDAITATWKGLAPSLTLRGLRVIDAQGSEALLLPAVRATLSWDSLLLLQPRFASLELDAPVLAVRRDAQGQLFVAGFAIRRKAEPDNRAAEWLLSQDEIRIRGARVTWRDEWHAADAVGAQPEDLVLSDVQFALRRSGREHRVALRATPPSDLAAPLDVRAVIDHPFFATRFADPTAWRGELYANVASGDVVAWRRWVPLPETMDAGRGRARVWMRFTAADAPAGSFAHRLAERTHRPIPEALDRIGDVTADLALDDLAVRWGTMEYAALASIDGRIVASQSATEQRFSALHMALQPRGGHVVPATDFHVERTIGASLDDETGKASLGAIDIGVSLGLVPGALVPPAIAEKFAALRPRGILDRMAASWSGPIATPKTFQLDASFERLALAAQAPTAEAVAAASREVVAANGLVRRPHAAFGQPGFDQLAGTLSATRTVVSDGAPLTTVALTVHGDDATITAPGLFDEPVLRLARLEAQVGVKVQGTDVEVRVERGALQNADLAATVDFTFRHGPNSGGVGENGGRGWIDLDARLSRAQVERVPRYLPNIIGEKARIYLRKALLGGQVSEATFRMHGALAQLDLRAMPGALATPNPVSVADALVAVRDARGGSAKTVEPVKAAVDAPVFHAAIKVKGATFLYGPARDPDAVVATGSTPATLPSIPWPAFEDLDADIVFDQTNLTVFGHSMRTFGYRLVDVRADLPALADPTHVLRVVGRGDGPLQDLVRFINASPVARWTRAFTATTTGTGEAAFALALDLPLTHPRDAVVAGSLRFANNDLALNAVIPPLKRLQGRLDFTDRGLAIDGLTGTTLGGPLRIDATTRSDGFIELGAAGTIDVDALKADRQSDEAGGVATPVSLAVGRAARWLSGGTRYRIDLRLRSRRMADLANDAPRGTVIAPEPTARPDLVVQSDLVGLAIALPAPLAKAADASWPLRIAITRSGDVAAAPDREDIRVSLDTPLGTLLDADVARRRDAQGAMTVARGSYVVGGGKAASDGPSVVDVTLPRLDLDAWRDVIRQATAPAPSTPPTTGPNAASGLDYLLPAHATLKTPLLRVAGRDFTQVAIDAERLPSGWQSEVVADQVAGHLSYTDVSGTAATRSGVAPASTGRLVARLSRVTIPPAEAGAPRVESALDASRRRDFPAIDVVVDRFELRGRPLGRLEVVAENVGSGDDRTWNLEKLGLTTPEARFTAHGSWGHAASAEHTRLDFDLQSSDVGALMDRFGLVRTIKNGTAQLSGDVSWTGGPSTIDFDTMRGRLKLAADKGQFLKADPGIAKLLNILSLQGLARRLTFDFNDVFAEGFAFDTVRADASVEHGIATTDDFTMKGVQATVFMSGNADLARETTNLHVRVVPDINAGAASLGVAVINPVLGLGTFVAQYLFKDRISKALTFEYNVVGPWTRPEVTKIDRNGKETPVVPRTKAAMRDEAPAKRID